MQIGSRNCCWQSTNLVTCRDFVCVLLKFLSCVHKLVSPCYWFHRRQLEFLLRISLRIIFSTANPCYTITLSLCEKCKWKSCNRVSLPSFVSSPIVSFASAPRTNIFCIKLIDTAVFLPKYYSLYACVVYRLYARLTNIFSCGFLAN